MKKSHLKLLIKQIIKESTSLKEMYGMDEKPKKANGLTTRAELDAGVMKAVNVEENQNGDLEQAKVIANKIWGDEVKSVELDNQRSKGRILSFLVNRNSTYYSHILKNESGQWFYLEGGVRSNRWKSVETFKGNVKEITANVSDFAVGVASSVIYSALKDFIQAHFSNIKLTEKNVNYILRALLLFKPALKKNADIGKVKSEIMGLVQTGKVRTTAELQSYIKSQDRDVNEESSTGAVAGYSTPFAFSKKNKLGSGKAIDAAKKYGKVVKSISEKQK